MGILPDMGPDKNMELQEFASRLGLKLDSPLVGSSKATGLYDGRRVSCEYVLVQANRSYKRSERFSFHVSVKLNNPVDRGFYFSITPENIFSSAFKFTGLMREVTLGNPAFDDKFFVKTNDEARAKRMLGPSVQEELLRGYDAFSLTFFLFHDGTFSLQRSDGVVPSLEMEKILSFACSVCGKMEESL